MIVCISMIFYGGHSSTHTPLFNILLGEHNKHKDIKHFSQ
jgi:hypothetical protein